MNSRTDSGVVAVPASAPTTTPIAHGAFGGKLYSFFAENKITSCVSSAISSFAEKKRQYGLVQPGSFDSLGREARSEPTHFTAHLLMHNFVDVSLSQLLFEGGKLDLAKILSNQFQISHSMSLAAGGAPSTYHFGAVFVEKNVPLARPLPYMNAHKQGYSVLFSMLELFARDGRQQRRLAGKGTPGSHRKLAYQRAVAAI